MANTFPGLNRAQVNALIAAYAAPISHTHTAKAISAGAPNATVNSATTAYSIPFGAGTTLIEGNARGVMPFACTAKNLYIRIRNAQPGGGSLVGTLYVNGSPTALTVTIPAGSSAGEYSDTTHSVSISAGDTYCMQFVNNDGANASASVTTWSMRLDIATG